MQRVKGFAAATSRLASDSARLAGDGVSHVYHIASDAAAKTKLEIQEAYLLRQTQMEIQFIPDEVKQLLKHFDESTAIVQQVSHDLQRRANTEQQAIHSYQRSAKSFTALSYIIQQGASEEGESPVGALSDLYDEMPAISEEHATALLAMHNRLQAFLDEDVAEIKPLRANFNQQVREMHIAKMRTQTLKSQGPGADEQLIEAAEQEEAEADVAFQGICHRVIADHTALLSRMGELLVTVMSGVLASEHKYAEARAAAISQNQRMDHGNSEAEMFRLGEMLLLPVPRADQNHA